MNIRFMLDTNVVGVFMHARSTSLDRRIAACRAGELGTSTIVFGETQYGLALRPGATRLAAAAKYLFGQIALLPWTAEVGERYGRLRAEMHRAGKSLQPLDMLIAAHALEAGATLVTNDHAFRFVPGLAVEDWTAA